MCTTEKSFHRLCIVLLAHLLPIYEVIRSAVATIIRHVYS